MREIKLNGLVSLLNRLVSIICSFLIPRMIIGSFGSETNGLISSITQYLSLISFLDLGMGAIIQAALYKPIAEKNIGMISSIYYKSKSFFNKIGLALVVYVLVLSVFIPMTLSSSVPKDSVVLLVLILSASQFCQFFIGISSQLIITSDQKGYVKEILQGIPNLINLLITFILVRNDQSILVVKSASAVIYLIPPLLLDRYVKTKYKISPAYKNSSLKFSQQWFGISQHIAYTIQESTDIIILSIFSTLNSVSIYSVYHIVFQGIKTLMNALTSGIRPYLGRSLYQNDTEMLTKQFQKIEFLIHFVVTVALSSAFQYVSPFISLYTKKISDINYHQPLFGYFMMIATYFYCLRLPYRAMVFSGGKFKETQFGTYMEAILNLGISMLLVKPYGLIGVAVGTAVSIGFSLIYYSYYVYKHMIFSPYAFVGRLLLTDIMIFIASNIVINIASGNMDSYLSWFVSGMIGFIICLAISVAAHFFFQKEAFTQTLKHLMQKRSS